MYSLTERTRIALKWLLSFTRAEWRFSDYPIRVRPNSPDNPELAWMAQLLNWPGPVGVGASPIEARSRLEANFEEIRASRKMAGEALPRPGTFVPIRFAPSGRVTSNPALLADFLEKVFGFGPSDPVFVSDESSLLDFGSEDDVDRFCGLIRRNYGVEVADLEWFVIADILERIDQRSRSDG